MAINGIRMVIIYETFLKNEYNTVLINREGDRVTCLMLKSLGLIIFMNITFAYFLYI